MANAHEKQQQVARITAKAWTDPAFKQRLLANPTATLKAEGLHIRSGVEMRVVEDTDTIVLRPKPTGELSMEDLENVAGGGRHFAGIWNGEPPLTEKRW